METASETLPGKDQSLPQDRFRKVCMKEEPYAWVLRSALDPSANHFKKRCSACGKRASNVCTNCSVIKYCNLACQERDSNAHEVECRAFAKIDCLDYLLSRHARLIGRILARQRSDARNVDTERDWNGYKGRCLEDLMSHARELEKNEEEIEDFQKVLLAFRAIYYDSEPVASATDSEVFEMYGKIITNAFSVCVYYLDRGSAAIGTALYLNCSRFDHSCNPDIVYSFDGPSINMLSFGQVDTQAPLFTKYIGSGTEHFGCAFTKERRKTLLDGYWFHCNCAHCSDVERDLMMRNSLAVNCPFCKKDDLVLLDEGDSVKCISCKETIEEDVKKSSVLLTLLETFEKIAELTIEPPDYFKEFDSDADAEESECSRSDEYLNNEIRWRLRAVRKVKRTLTLGKGLFHPSKNVHMLRLFEVLTDNYRFLAEAYWDFAMSETSIAEEGFHSAASEAAYGVKFKEAANKAIRYGIKCLKFYKFYLSPFSMWQSCQQYITADLLLRLHRYSEALEFLRSSKEIWIMNVGNGHKCVRKLERLIDRTNKKISKVDSMKL